MMVFNSLLYLWYGAVATGMGHRGHGSSIALQCDAICDRFHSTKYRGKCNMLLCCSVLPWIRPLSHTFPIMEQAGKLLLSVGDFQWAGYSLVWSNLKRLFQGIFTLKLSLRWTCLLI
jgi:hypothetical protein